MLVQDIMAKSPAVATPETPIVEIAKMMVEHDCGAIPVVTSQDSPKPVGIITDRDIVVRILAAEKKAMESMAKDAMTEGVATVGPNMTLEAAALIMQEHQIRRVPVVDEAGNVIGIVAQADIALNSPREAGEMVAEVSEDRAESGDYAG